MNTNEKALNSAANYHVDMQYPMGVEREYPINDFIAGAEWMKKQIESDLAKSQEKCNKYEGVFGAILSTSGMITTFDKGGIDDAYREAIKLAEQALKQDD